MNSTVKLSCHCGNIRLTIPKLPSALRDCDCPICNRLGALWGDYQAEEVTVEANEPMAAYQWSAADSQLHHCRRCGCTTHYFSKKEADGLAIGINFRMLDRRKLEEIPVV